MPSPGGDLYCKMMFFWRPSRAKQVVWPSFVVRNLID